MQVRDQSLLRGAVQLQEAQHSQCSLPIVMPVCCQAAQPSNGNATEAAAPSLRDRRTSWQSRCARQAYINLPFLAAELQQPGAAARLAARRAKQQEHRMSQPRNNRQVSTLGTLDPGARSGGCAGHGAAGAGASHASPAACVRGNVHRPHHARRHAPPHR